MGKRIWPRWVDVLLLVIVVLVGLAMWPNYLEPRGKRSRVSRVKNDQRSLATGIETYFIDNNIYPLMRRAWQSPALADTCFHPAFAGVKKSE